MVAAFVAINIDACLLGVRISSRVRALVPPLLMTFTTSFPSEASVSTGTLMMSARLSRAN